MGANGFIRKIATIMSANVVGYSKLMDDDETATAQTLTLYKNEMAALINQHRGRVIDFSCNNMLSEFAIAMDAVKCAVAIQKEFISRNTALPENRKMRFRMGINLGKVIQEEDRIFGDCVNIVERLKSLADPGGITVSKTVFDQIENKLPLGYQYLGEHSVNNISEPVRVYKVFIQQ